MDIRSKLQKKSHKFLNYRCDMYGSEKESDLDYIFWAAGMFNQATPVLYLDNMRVNKLIHIWELKGIKK